MAVIDSMVVFARGPGAWQSLGAYVGSTVACGSWLAAILTCPTALLVVVARKYRSTVSSSWRWGLLVAQGFALSVAAVCILLIRPWDAVVSWPYIVVPVVGIVAGLVIAWLEHSMPLRFRALTYLGFGLAALALDALVYRRLYRGLHKVLFFVALVLLARSAALLREQTQPRLTRWFLALLAVCHLTLLTDLGPARHAGWWHGVVQPKVFGFIHTLADVDGDGHAAVFGGGDCDDGDASSHPGACEVPDNGRDDNCNGLADGSYEKNAQRADEVFPRRRPDVFLVMVDTLRADFGRLPRGEAAPEVDSFAQGALDFRRAYTPYPSTFRAMMAMCQSRSWRSIDSDAPQLLGWMASLGYDAQLWIGTEELVGGAAKVIHLDRTTGDPFHVADTSTKGTWSERQVERAVAELQEKDAPPRFRWLHFLDPHVPLVRGAGSRLERYRAEVQHVSRVFGQLLDALEETERGRQAVVIFLSDHGEEYEDHGGRFHGATLYEENIAVPLIMRLPGVTPAEITQVATLLDIVPTLGDYLGEPLQSGWEGVSWLRPVPAERAVFSQIEPVANLGGQGRPEMHAVMRGGYKLVHNITANLVELYDVAADRDERDSLTSIEGQRVADMLGQLAIWQDRPGCQSF